jgi:uncharacterized membrane protein
VGGDCGWIGVCMCVCVCVCVCVVVVVVMMVEVANTQQQGKNSTLRTGAPQKKKAGKARTHSVK